MAKVKDLVMQQFKQNYQVAALYDLNASRSDLQAIRTVSSDDRHCTCRANLQIEFELNGDMKTALASKPANSPERQMMDAMFGNRSRSTDLRYSVERTDDGKDLYVSVQPF